jgi:hypothetical protein
MRKYKFTLMVGSDKENGKIFEDIVIYDEVDLQGKTESQISELVERDYQEWKKSLLHEYWEQV